MLHFRRTHVALALGVVCAAATLAAVHRVAVAQRRRAPILHIANPRTTAGASAPVSTEAGSGPTTIAGVIDGFDPSHMRRERGRYVAQLESGLRAVLTVQPDWQRSIDALVDGYHFPRAAIVVLDTDTGRVLAYTSRGEPGAGDMARDATAPAASVFKIVTSGALVERGLGVDTMTCYSGGFHSLRARDLIADPRRDRECISLGQAFGRSANTVFARRAIERLTPAELLTTAHGWGYGESVPFDALVSPGEVEMPAENLEFARAAAGFWHSHLSAVHAAVIAQAIARSGEMQRPFIVENVIDAQGRVLAVGAPQTWRRAVSSDAAAALARMMAFSVRDGTAQSSFHDAAGRTYLPGIDVGGKTGTLTAASPYRAYTWFVGNAAAANRRVSFAVMVANGPVWTVRAPVLARQVLQIVYRGRATP